MGLVSSQYVGTDVLIYAAVILGCFALQLLCHYASTAISHTAAFSITEDIRLSVTKKNAENAAGIYAGQRQRIFQEYAYG